MNEVTDNAASSPLALRRLVAEMAEGLLLLAVIAAVPAILTAGLLVGPLVLVVRQVARRARSQGSPARLPGSISAQGNGGS